MSKPFCENCIHYDVCRIQAEYEHEYIITFFPHNEDCKQFKNKDDVAEVRHCEWVYDHWCEFKCSACGHFSKTEPRGKENYCPNCGAKMDGGVKNG